MRQTYYSYAHLRSPTNAWPGVVVTGTVSAVAAGSFTAFQSFTGVNTSEAFALPVALLANQATGEQACCSS
jgi:uncharacterized protein (DUF2062 family)